MHDVELDAFRAAYPSVRDAVTACEKPTWIARLSFDAAKDKKSIIRSTASAGSSLEVSDAAAWRALLLPLLEPFEVIDHWTGNETEEGKTRESLSFENFRAAFLPFCVAWLFWGLVAGGELWTGRSHAVLLATGVAVGVVVLGFSLMKVWFRWLRRVQVRRLTADKAFATALRRLARGAKQNPDAERVRIHTSILRRECLEVLDREAAFQ